MIDAGAEWAQEIAQNLERAEIILLLVSADFIDSDYCYGVELARAFLEMVLIENLTVRLMRLNFGILQEQLQKCVTI